MSFFDRIIGKNQAFKECPRCLGKGHVDWDDIKRLNQELKWMPGKCAYCDGFGRIDPKIESNVPVEASFLVNNLPEDERKRILDGHPDALERGRQHDEQVEVFINQITYLHFDGGLNPFQIATFFLIGCEDLDAYENEKRELVEYVKIIVEKKLDKN